MTDRIIGTGHDAASSPEEGWVSFRDRLVLSVVGAVQGLALFILSEPWSRKWDAADIVSSRVFVAVALGVFVLLYQRASWKRDLPFALGVGLLVGLLFKVSHEIAGVVQLQAFYATAILCFVIPIAFYQAARDAPRFSFPYARLYLHAWMNKMVPFVGGFLVACAWAILFLWWKLFALIGIDFFRELFTEKVFIFVFSSTIFALGVGVARERPSVIQALLKIVMALFGMLAPLLAMVSILFVGALPFSGLEKLWATSYSTHVLLVIPFVFILFVNAVIQTGASENRFRPPLDKLIMIGNLIMPVFVGLVFWALYLRVAQYGWTPRRLIVTNVSVVASAYTLAYAFVVLRWRGDWMKGAVKVNPYLAVGALLVSICFHLPPFEPTAISARDQVERLRSGAIPPDKFDFAFLRLKLGDAGKAAFEQLDADESLKENATVAAAMDKARAQKHYFRPRRTAQVMPSGPKDIELQNIAAYMAITPEGAEIPKAPVSAWISSNRYWFINCWSEKQIARNGKCVMALLDLNQDGRDDLVFMPRTARLQTKLRQADESWKPGPTYFSGAAATKQQAMRDAAAQGKISTAPSEMQDIIIDGVRFK